MRLSIAGRQGESLREAGGPSEGAASTSRGGLTHLLKWHPLRHSYFLFRAKTRHEEAEPSVLRRTLGPRSETVLVNGVRYIFCCYNFSHSFGCFLFSFSTVSRVYCRDKLWRVVLSGFVSQGSLLFLYHYVQRESGNSM